MLLLPSRTLAHSSSGDSAPGRTQPAPTIAMGSNAVISPPRGRTEHRLHSGELEDRSSVDRGHGRVADRVRIAGVARRDRRAKWADRRAGLVDDALLDRDR